MDVLVDILENGGQTEENTYKGNKKKMTAYPDNTFSVGPKKKSSQTAMLHWQ